jgi:hypothetical protein
MSTVVVESTSPPNAVVHTKLDYAIVALSAGFIFVLLFSGYFEREVLVLHLFQSLIYVAVAVLSWRHSKWGYAAAICVATLWNAYNVKSGFVFDAGFRQWSAWLQTGEIKNPVHWIAPPAWFDHALLIVCCVWAYLRLPNKRPLDAVVFVAASALTIGYFSLILALMGSQFLQQALAWIGLA